MPHFRKKPVVIEAFQYVGAESADFICLWAVSFVSCVNGHMTVQTKEGPLNAPVGSWIIRGVHGEFYPCEPSIFAATYEETNRQHPPCPHDSRTRGERDVFWTCERCGEEIPVGYD